MIPNLTKDIANFLTVEPETLDRVGRAISTVTSEALLALARRKAGVRRQGAQPEGRIIESSPQRSSA